MKKIFNFFIEIERPFKRVIQVFFDIFFIFLSVYLALLLRLGQQFDLSFFTNTFPILIITLPVTLIVFTKLGHYRAILRYISAKAMNVTIIGVLISALTIYISSVILSINIPKSLPIIYFGVLLFFIGGTRLFYREIYIDFWGSEGRVIVAHESLDVFFCRKKNHRSLSNNFEVSMDNMKKENTNASEALLNLYEKVFLDIKNKNFFTDLSSKNWMKLLTLE